MTLLEDEDVTENRTVTDGDNNSNTASSTVSSKGNEPFDIVASKNANSAHYTSSHSTIPITTNISLSPAVSAFQQFWPSPGSTPSLLSSSPQSASNNSLPERSHSNNSSSPSDYASSHHSSNISISNNNNNNNNNHNSNNINVGHNGRPMENSPVIPIHIKDGYFYKDKIVILDQEKKEQLLKVGTILLQGEWTYWYDRYVPNLPASEYEANLQVISTVGTVQKFWSVYNNIDGPEKLGFRSNLHFMRKGIKPIWEDPKNEYGGSYNFKVNKNQSPLVWRDLLVLLIGEKVEHWLQDIVCGVSVSSRQHCDNYQIWVSSGQDKNEQEDGSIKATLADLLSPAEIQSFYFKIHKNHAAFQKEGIPNNSSNRSNNNNNHNSSNNSNSNLYSKYSNNNSNTNITRPPPLTEMRRKITEESIERVVADIERLSLKQKSIRKVSSKTSITSSS